MASSRCGTRRVDLYRARQPPVTMCSRPSRCLRRHAGRGNSGSSVSVQLLCCRHGSVPLELCGKPPPGLLASHQGRLLQKAARHPAAADPALPQRRRYKAPSNTFRDRNYGREAEEQAGDAPTPAIAFLIPIRPPEALQVDRTAKSHPSGSRLLEPNAAATAEPSCCSGCTSPPEKAPRPYRGTPDRFPRQQSRGGRGQSHPKSLYRPPSSRYDANSQLAGQERAQEARLPRMPSRRTGKPPSRNGLESGQRGPFR
eukprot:GHVT01024401.1.p1 GENE.GHVT01024401.1~~GHVT01024401.1.p1  ORF type:complete len:256 (-),score=39.62 GHVT01024401.1:361-1128(-)